MIYPVNSILPVDDLTPFLNFVLCIDWLLGESSSEDLRFLIEPARLELPIYGSKVLSLVLPFVVCKLLRFLPCFLTGISSLNRFATFDYLLSTSSPSACIATLLVVLVNDDMTWCFSLASVLRPFLNAASCPRKCLFCFSRLPIVFLIWRYFCSWFLLISSIHACLSNSSFSSYFRLSSLSSSSRNFYSCLAISSPTAGSFLIVSFFCNFMVLCEDSCFWSS